MSSPRGTSSSQPWRRGATFSRPSPTTPYKPPRAGLRPPLGTPLPGESLLNPAVRLNGFDSNTVIEGSPSWWGNTVLFCDGFVFGDNVTMASSVSFADGGVVR